MHSRNQSNGAVGADEVMAVTQPGSTAAKPYRAPVVTRLDVEGTAAGGGILPDGATGAFISGGGTS